MSGRVYVFTDCDLDGVGSYMVANWLISDEMPYTVTTCKNFREDFLRWANHNKVSDYETVYIYDINVAEHSDLLDHDNIVIIDHHNGKDGYVSYEKATLVLDQNFTSTTKLVLKTLLNKNSELKSKLTPNKAKLITLIDDYDSYNLKYSESVGLNTILWSYTGDRVSKFINEFKEGFTSFTPFHKNMINIASKKVEDTINTSDIFYIDLPIDGKKRKVICIQCNHNINEIADGLIKKYNADICLVVNLKSKGVSFRKNKTCDVNLNIMSQKLCNGGGHSDSAGGQITDKFLKLSKMFTKL